MKHFIKLIVLITIFSLISSFGFARKYIGYSSFDESLNTFDYAKQGAELGIGIGAAAGCLKYVANDKEQKHLLKGPLYGFLFGAVFGISLSIIDSTRENSGLPDIIIKDMRAGAGIGTGVGLCIGLIRMIDTEEGTDLFNATAWGTLIGSLAGLTIGIIEGPAAIREFAYIDKFLSKIKIVRIDKNTMYLKFNARI